MTAHGILIVDKPCGPTSHDVVAGARRLYDTRAVGHAGTLDPMASGVLLLLLGEATKLSNYLTLDDKRYLAEVTLGTATTTLDAEGEVTERVTPLPPDPEALTAALRAELARSTQLPPAVSAIKVAGVAAHRRIRRGEAVALEPRPVHVLGLELLSLEFPRLQLALHVSKGYYVRSFARDLGLSLGIPAHLSALRRSASGVFGVDEAVAWPTALAPPLVATADAARRALPWTTLSDSGTARARRGQQLSDQDFSGDARSVHQVAQKRGRPVAWLDQAGSLVALGEARERGYAVVRGFSAH